MDDTVLCNICSTLQHRVKVAGFTAVLTVLLLLYFIDGPLQPVSEVVATI